jgi:hypothetical protein
VKRSLWPTVSLITGDGLALLLFVYLGQREHETLDPARPLVGVILQTAVFLLPWLVAGWWLGAFTAGAGKELSRPAFLSRTLNAWLVAAPLALLLRAFLLDRAVIPTLFLLVTLGLGGAALFTWRLLFLLWQHRSQHPS